MATHSSILAWRIPWTEESGGLQLVGSHFHFLTRQWPAMPLQSQLFKARVGLEQRSPKVLKKVHVC